jgi:hypothetical protein
LRLPLSERRLVFALLLGQERGEGVEVGGLRSAEESLHHTAVDGGTVEGGAHGRGHLATWPGAAVAGLGLVRHTHLSAAAATDGEALEQGRPLACGAMAGLVAVPVLDIVAELGLIRLILPPTDVLAIHRFALTRWLRLPTSARDGVLVEMRKEAGPYVVTGRSAPSSAPA